jgi:beta-lactam-binding protein with PASTA domain
MKNIFVLTVAALALAFFALPVQAQQVAVPNVVGMPSDQAVKTLQACGLKSSITFEKTATKALAGKVSKQNPAAGQKAATNSVVVLTAYLYVETVQVSVAPPVSQNPATPPPASTSVPTPTVNPMPLEKAREIAKKAGYDLTVSSYKDTTNKALDNYVVEQQGLVLKGSKAFSVTVARYKAPQAVPHVTGMSLDAAVSQLKRFGYETRLVEAPVADPALSEKVVKQMFQPDAGTNRVAITVGVYGANRTVNGIPNVMFLEEAQAVSLLKKAGYAPQVTYDEISDKALLSKYQGKVMLFDAVVPPGTKTVYVIVGRSALVTAPNFIGQTRSQAIAWSAKSVNSGDPGAIRLTIRDREVSTPGQVNVILEQNPAPGANIAKGSEIVLTAGKAPPPPPASRFVPDVFNLSREEALRKLEAAGCGATAGTKETAWPEQDGKVIWMDAAPKSICKKDVKVGIKVGKYTPGAIDVRVTPMPADKRYYMTIKGGTPPFNIDLTYEAVPVPGQKLVEIVPLKSSPGAKVLTSDYRIIPHITTKAKIVITDAKGVKHVYDLDLKKDAQ